MSMIDTLATAIAFSLFGGAVAFQWAFLRRLRMHHADKWRELGEPQMFPNSSRATGHSLQMFLLRGRYRYLGDTRLNTLGLFSNVCLLALLGIILAGLLWVAIRAVGQ